MGLVDFEQIKIHFGDDRLLIEQLVEIFKETYPEVLDSLKIAVNEQEPRKIELHAHTLKGMVSNLFCQKVAQKCFELEARGRAGTLVGDELDITTRIEELILTMLEEYEKVNYDE